MLSTGSKTGLDQVAMTALQGQGADYSLKELFNLPIDFPHERYQMVRSLSCCAGASTFEAHDKTSNKKVFVKFIDRPIEFAGLYQDFITSFDSKDAGIVPALKLYDPIQSYLQKDPSGPSLSDTKVRNLQSLGFDSLTTKFDLEHPNAQFSSFWVAIVKEYVEGAVPLHQFIRANNSGDISWLAPKVEELVEQLCLKSLVVRDLIERPDGSLTGNILVIPDERRVCISDLEYSDILPLEACKQAYRILMLRFYDLIDGKN